MMVTCILIMDFGIHSFSIPFDKYFASNNAGTLYECSFGSPGTMRLVASWSSPGETGGMLGNHSISLLADAWAKGIRDFDPEKALKAYAHEAMNKGPWGGANGRGFWKEYFQLGYVPYLNQWVLVHKLGICI